MFMCCVCAFSLRHESSHMILGDEPLISDVVSQTLHEKKEGRNFFGFLAQPPLGKNACKPWIENASKTGLIRFCRFSKTDRIEYEFSKI
jgi:hypothetical protein